MNASLLVPLTLLTLTLTAQAQTVRIAVSKIGVLPSERTPIVLNLRERNPFAGKEAKTIETALEDRVSEESVIRRLIGQMRVTGLVMSEDSNKALLERVVLEEGQVLPWLMPNQTERLRVGKITQEQAEIFFIESDERIEPRKIVIPIQLKPDVKQRWYPTDGSAPVTPSEP